MDTTWLDATAQADMVRRGEVSPAELVDAAIARIEKVNPQLDAVIRTRFDQARLEARRGLPDGPFRGVPILLKDLGCMVAGEATAFGIGPLRDLTWSVTSYLAEQFVAAGLVVLGRTNVPEFGTTVRVSQGPLIGEAWAGGTIDGALTRTVRDAAGLLDVISARMPGEPYYAPPLPRPLAAEVGADPGRLRIGVIDHPGGDRSLDDPQCRAAVATAARLLESLGHHVEEAAPAAMFDEEFSGSFTTIIAADTEATFRAFEAALGRPISDHEIETRNVAYRRAGEALGAVEYLQARVWIGQWTRRMARWWDDHDLLVTPTLGAPAPELGWFTAQGLQEEGRRIAGFIPYTAQFNMTGQPAVSLPLHWTPGDLPVGVQIVAGYGREDRLVQVASQLEQAAPWAERLPGIHA